MNVRQELEKIIISAIIFDQGFAEVASILQIKNFTNPTYGKLFTAAGTLYPTKPVNLITLYNHLRIAEPEFLEELVQVIIRLDSGRIACNQLRHNCLLVLQLDIENTFRNDLINWRAQRIAGEQAVEVAVLTEMIEFFVAPGIDILAFIDKAMVYFDMQNMVPEYEATKQFNIDIGLKAKGIKRTTTLDAALSAAYRIADASHDVKLICNKFLDAVSSMIITNQIKNNYSQAADLL